MILYLDTEFNGFKGQLISMALVPEDENIPNFYEELYLQPEVHVDQWVKENVIFKLDNKMVYFSEFQDRLRIYLSQFDKVEIIADWPDDIKYFCEILITSPGKKFTTPPLSFVIDDRIYYTSKVPHHALHDALAIREYYRETN